MRRHKDRPCEFARLVTWIDLRIVFLLLLYPGELTDSRAVGIRSRYGSPPSTSAIVRDRLYSWFK